MPCIGFAANLHSMMGRFLGDTSLEMFGDPPPLDLFITELLRHGLPRS